MKKNKKIISTLLLVAILFSINITSAFAENLVANNEPKVYKEGTNTLNLEGEFIANGSDGAICVKNGAQLTINGTDETRVHGTLGADKYSMALWAIGEKTKVVINGGYFTNETDGSDRGTDLIYAYGDAAIEINGGKFKAATPKWTLNCNDGSKTPIIVKGGSFYNFDPSNADVGEGEIVVPEGYKVVKNGDWYTVYGTHTITVKDVEGGKVTANKTKAIVGETIALTVETKEGYKLERIDVDADRMGDSLIGTTTFEMFNSDVTVTPVFTKLKTNAEVPNNVANAEKVESMLIEALKENKELAEAIKNKNVEIKVEVKEKEVTKTEKETIGTAVNQKDTDLKVANYIDITIIVKDADNGDSLGKLSTVKEAITFTVAVPENLPKLEEGYERIFYIVRNHNGEIDLLDATEANGELKFKSDKFSTYAIAYKDVKKATDTTDDATDSTIKDDEEIKNVETNNPKTGDNIIMYISIAIVAVAGIIILKKVNTTKKRKH